MVDVGSARARLLLDTSGFAKGLNKAQGQMGSFQKRSGVLSKSLGGIAKVAKVGAVAVGTAFTAMAASSVKTGMAFDKAMSQVAATMGKSVDDIEDLRKFAIKMGEDTKFSATEAAEALNYMALAGYDSKQSMEMLPKVLNLAAAGNIDLARASDMVTDTQTAFGISSKRTGQMVDEMAKAASTGNTSVEQLGDAFLTVGGLAKELNGGVVKLKDGTTKSVDGVQELEIALTAMANAGVKGSEAGTHMRNMLLKLSSPTKEGAETFKRLGVDVFDAQGKMKSLQDIFSDLNTSMSKLTQKEKLQAISDIFNTRDTAASEALLSAVGQDWDGIGESILNAKGAAQKMADTQLDNLAGDVTLAKSAFESLQIAISDTAKGPLRSFVQIGTQGIKDITKAIRTGDIEGLFTKIGKGFSELSNGLVKQLPEMTKVGLDMAVSIGENFTKGLPTLLRNVVDSAFQIGNTLLKTLTEAIGKTDFASTVGKSLDVVGSLVKDIRAKAGTLVDSGLQLILKLAQGFADSMPTLIEKVPTIISDIAGIINDNAPKLLLAGAKIILTLGIGLIKAIPALVKNLPKIIKAIWDVFTAVQWWNLGGNIIKGLINGIKKMMSKVPVAAKNIVNAIWNVVKTLPSKLGNLGRSAIHMLVSAVKGTLGLVKSGFAQVLKLGIGAIKALPSKLRELGAKALKLFVQAAKSYWSAVRETFTSIGTKAVEALKGLPAKMLKVGGDIVKGLIKGVKGKAKEAVGAVASLGTSMLNSIKKALDIHSPSRLFQKQVGWNIVEGVVKGVKEKTSKGKKTAEQMARDIYKAAFNKLETLRSTKKNSLSAEDEASYWHLVMKHMKKGTSGYVSAYHKYLQARKKAKDQAAREEKQYNKSMESLEKEYVNNVKELYTELKKEIDDLNAKYKEAYDNRVSEILSAMSTFGKYVDPATEAMEKAQETYNKALETFQKAQNEFAEGKLTVEEFTEAQRELTKAQIEYEDATSEYSPQGLIDNLQTQVDAIQKYNEAITTLEGKSIIPPEMVEEIKKQGVNATGQIEAINTMTDEQLAKYVELWKQKYQLAEQQAEEELKPLKDATAKAIEEATTTTEDKLAKLRKKYVKQMHKLGTDGKTAGRNAGKATVQGLLQGLEAKRSDLRAKLASIYSEVKSGMDRINALMSQASSAASNSEGGKHSHRDGLGYVPYNGYNAQLHEGEMVLTKNEADSYRQGKASSYNFVFNSPKAIDPYEANKLFKETLRKLEEGFA